MANILNLWSGILSFIVGAALAYALWGPVKDFTDLLSTEARILTQVAFTLVMLVIILMNPIGMVISDDRGF